MSHTRFTFTIDEVRDLLLNEVRQRLRHAPPEGTKVRLCKTTVWGQEVDAMPDFDVVVIDVPNKE